MRVDREIRRDETRELLMQLRHSSQITHLFYCLRFFFHRHEYVIKWMKSIATNTSVVDANGRGTG